MTNEVTIQGQGRMTPIRMDGACRREYLALVQHKMGDEAAVATRDVAIDVVSNCIKAYEESFGLGEVGDGGKSPITVKKAAWAASEDLPPTTGLLYGKVQSGKTNASMASVALALANTALRLTIGRRSDRALNGGKDLGSATL